MIGYLVGAVESGGCVLTGGAAELETTQGGACSDGLQHTGGGIRSNGKIKEKKTKQTQQCFPKCGSRSAKRPEDESM